MDIDGAHAHAWQLKQVRAERVDAHPVSVTVIFFFQPQRNYDLLLILDGISNSALHTVTDCTLAVFCKRSAMRGGGDVVYASVTLVQSNHF